jgi:hypothetical protein
MSTATPSPRGSKKDCLSCRITGTMVCVALSGYLSLQQYAKPAKSPGQRFITLSMAGSFLALGIARAVVD